MTECEKCKKEGRKNCPCGKKKKKKVKTLTRTTKKVKTKGSAGPASYSGNKRTPGASGNFYSITGSM
tara:strand:- start:410 stop:610 length:201 start_codon:yes stop_codon:yes gene_type:complete